MWLMDSDDEDWLLLNHQDLLGDRCWQLERGFCVLLEKSDEFSGRFLCNYESVLKCHLYTEGILQQSSYVNIKIFDM